jgi:large subunit ribosomal protein L33
MATPKKNVRKVTLACVECSERNYSTPKSQSQATERLELKKYCPRCGAHTIHRETR